MTLSEELREAAGAEKGVALYPGQYVIVRTKGGERVATGTIVYVDEAMHTVRVSSIGWQADQNLDVDVEKYDLWVVAPEDVPMQKSLVNGPGRIGA